MYQKMEAAVFALIAWSLAVATMSEKIFFPGNPPTLSKGILEIEGYYAESTLIPPVVLSHIQEQEKTYTQDNGHSETEPRFLLPSLPNSAADRQTFDPSSFSPFRITDTVTVTQVVPPLCVSCTCLQGSQTCAAAGGYQLLRLSATTAANGITALSATNAVACSTPPTAAGTATITCVVPPSATLSACDPSCRSISGDCTTNPSAANCPQIATLAVCNTPCQNLAIGAKVACNSAYPAVITSRPTTACSTTTRKREAEHSDYMPAIRSSIESSVGSRTARLFGLQISRTTITKTTTATGTVTATYVASGNCLPNNILAAPDC